MYIVITKNKVFTASSLKKLEKQNDLKLQESDFVPHGADQVCQLSDKDIEIALDAHRLSLIPIAKLFRKDNTSMIYFIVIILLEVILLGKK